MRIVLRLLFSVDKMDNRSGYPLTHISYDDSDNYDLNLKVGGKRLNKDPTMKSTLDRDDIERFWIRVFLHTSDNFLERCIERAYRDFNRTMHGIGDNENKEAYSRLSNLVKSIVEEITTKNISDQTQYDSWHKDKCEFLQKGFMTELGYELNVGQAQKWINMTLKYLFALGEGRIKGISKNYEFYHIPIDNIIQEKLESEGIEKFKTRWSCIKKYSDYLDYQKRVREHYSGQIPLDVEFKLFNS